MVLWLSLKPVTLVFRWSTSAGLAFRDNELNGKCSTQNVTFAGAYLFLSIYRSKDLFQSSFSSIYGFVSGLCRKAILSCLLAILRKVQRELLWTFKQISLISFALSLFDVKYLDSFSILLHTAIPNKDLTRRSCLFQILVLLLEDHRESQHNIHPEIETRNVSQRF